MKNKNAQAMVALRWAKTTKKDRVAHAQKMVKARQEKKEVVNK